MSKAPKFLTFNDGMAHFRSIENVAAPGDKPQEKLVAKIKLPFEYLTIGAKRNYDAMQADVRLDELIRTPLHRCISTQDICIIEGTQYRIEQVQHDPGTAPPSSKFSLSKLEQNYEFEGI